MPKFLALEDIQKIASEGGQAQTICNNFMNDLRTH
jgi:hypothetical protein